MSGAPGADTGRVVRIRRILAIALMALLACAAAGISSALGAHAHRDGADRPRCHTTVRIHSHGAYVLHRVPVRCRRAARRRAPAHHGSRLHGRLHSRTGPRRTRRARPLRRNVRHRTSAADVNGACQDAQLSPTAWNVERIRAAVLCLVNRERAAHGEAALVANAALQRAAQSHTESMAFGSYFDHVGPGGDRPADRMRSAGYLTRTGGFEVGENIAWGTLWLGSPRAIVAAWMDSPGHRANILDARYRDTAVGVSPHPPASLAHGLPGGIYTQDFAVLTGR